MNKFLERLHDTLFDPDIRAAMIHYASLKIFRLLRERTGIIVKNGELRDGDLAWFPDTDTEYADVGVGHIAVAQSPTKTEGMVTWLAETGAWGVILRGSSEVFRHENKELSFDYIVNSCGIPLNEIEWSVDYE